MFIRVIGVLLLGALGCVDFRSAYGSIHWQSLVLIVGMMPFSLALQRTGGVDLAAGWLTMMTDAVGPYGLLAALFVVTAMLGLFVSNTATVSLLINPVDDPPVLATVGNQTIAEGAFLAFTLRVDRDRFSQ